MANEYEILSIGNAIVDIVSHVSEDFISAHSLQKGTMRLIDESQSMAMLATLGDTLQAPGGSAANTAACIASLGASSAYLGKVAEDELGLAFRKGMSHAGVDFSGGETYDDISTANCLAVVTPDGERTMSTFLGACRELGRNDVSEDLIRDSKLIFLEGYLFDSPSSSEALVHAAHVARGHGNLVGLTLSDANCVRRNLPSFKSLIAANLVDVVVANEKEIVALLGDERPGITLEEAFDICRFSHPGITTVVTLGSEGALAIADRDIITVPAFKVDRIVDLVGAGDSFAAGYLVGHVRGYTIKEALTLGAACAAEIITTNGARPTRPLADLPHASSLLFRDARVLA